MQNGYFRLVNDSKGYGIALYQPKGGGDEIPKEELLQYLNDYKISYNEKMLEMMILLEEDEICHLGSGECPEYPETYNMQISEDGMLATVRFFPPSETGKRMTFDDFMKDLRFKNIKYGIQEKYLREHFSSEGTYCTDILVAKGRAAERGEDARIEYCFNTDNRRHPTQNKDGSVDYFHLSIINHCKKGDLLARIIPEKPGKEGSNIFGEPINVGEVKRQTLKFGRNIELSEDKLSITSMVDGHVSLVDDKVFVSDVFQIENVDVSTGNIDFEGSVEISGFVATNYEVKASGNVIINGIVEGARVIAGGNIIIAKGMNGMNKGYLKAGGNVVVKFLENARVVSGGYVEAEAILHSRVSAGSEVRVDGRKGIIVGGYVQASNKITAKTIGASMGAVTILEVGVNPLIKTQYDRMQKVIADNTKTIKNGETILNNFREKMKKGVQYNEGQLKYMKSVAALVKEKAADMEQMSQRLERLRSMLETQKQAEVVVNDQIYPGTTIIIGDISKTLQVNYHYCKFIKDAGDIKMAPL